MPIATTHYDFNTQKNVTTVAFVGAVLTVTSCAAERHTHTLECKEAVVVFEATVWTGEVIKTVEYGLLCWCCGTAEKRAAIEASAQVDASDETLELAAAWTKQTAINAERTRRNEAFDAAEALRVRRQSAVTQGKLALCFAGKAAGSVGLVFWTRQEVNGLRCGMALTDRKENGRTADVAWQDADQLVTLPADFLALASARFSGFNLKLQLVLGELRGLKPAWATVLRGMQELPDSTTALFTLMERLAADETAFNAYALAVEAYTLSCAGWLMDSLSADAAVRRASKKASEAFWIRTSYSLRSVLDPSVLPAVEEAYAALVASDAAETAREEAKSAKEAARIEREAAKTNRTAEKAAKDAEKAAKAAERAAKAAAKMSRTADVTANA